MTISVSQFRPDLPTVALVIDFGPILSIKEEYRQQAKALWHQIADRHTTFLRQRFIGHAMGGGSWPPLTSETLKRKAREMQQFGFSGNVNWILMRSNRMSESITYAIRPDLRGYVTGFIQENKRYPNTAYCNQTVANLARIHAGGQGGVPVRQVVGRPTNAEWRELVTLARDHFRKIVNGMNQNTTLRMKVPE